MSYKILHLPTGTYIYHITGSELNCSFYAEDELNTNQFTFKAGDITHIYKFHTCLTNLIDIINVNKDYFSAWISIPEHFILLEIDENEI